MRNSIDAAADFAIIEALIPWSCPSVFTPLDGSGPYMLEEIIGAGRQAAVYKARDMSVAQDGTERFVAVKIYPRNSGPKHIFPHQTTARLPGVAEILSRGELDGCHFFVSEFVDGPSLLTWSGSATPRQIAAKMAGVGEAVGGLHRAGFIVRDLKPSNVLIHPYGPIRLIDYESIGQMGQMAQDTQGSVAFTAPEIIQDAHLPVGPTVDVYSLGSMLYHLLRGRSPFGDTREEIEASIAQNKQPAPPGIDPTLDAICLRALSCEPEERHQSASEFADDLRAWIGHRPIEWLGSSLKDRFLLRTKRTPVQTTLLWLVPLGALGAVVWWAVSNRAHMQSANQTLSSELALVTEELDTVKEDGKKLIKHLANMARYSSNGHRDSMPVAFIWFDLINDIESANSVLHATTVPDRITLLEEFIRIQHDAGSNTHFDTIAAEFLYVYYLVVDGQWMPAQHFAETYLPDMHATLDADDPLLIGTRILNQVAAVMYQLGSTTHEDDVQVALTALDALYSQTWNIGGLDAVAKLIEALADELRQRTPTLSPAPTK